MVFAMIKRFSSLAVRSMAFAKFVSLLERLQPQRANLLRVLTYHRVDEPDAHPELYPGLISATPAAFDEQMEYLSTRFRVLSMTEAMDALNRRIEIPPKAVLVTFDDAYVDFAEHAWPIMRRYGIPATLFVPTGFPDHPERVFWWDRLHDALRTTDVERLDTPLGAFVLKTAARRQQCFRRLRKHVKSLPHAEAMAFVDDTAKKLHARPAQNRVLSWAELRRLGGEGVQLGAHTRNHPMMDRIDADTARSELSGSLADLEREIGSVLPIFAYPSGHANGDLAAALKQQGITLGFTTRRGINNLNRLDPLLLRRINVGRQTNVALLRAQLASW